MEIDLSRYDSYREAYDQFEWDVPETFNIADVICGRWADRDDGKRRAALFYEDETDLTETYTFWQTRRIANGVSNMLEGVGATRGTRVGIVLPQRPETLFANLGVLQMGAVSVPLSVLYGTEGLRYRLDHSQTQIAIVDRQRADVLDELRDDLNHLETVITLDDPDEIDGQSWENGLATASRNYETVETNAEDSAYMIYTSGTTGKPKGAHHAHRKLLGYIPGWQMINEFLATRPSTTRRPVGRGSVVCSPSYGARGITASQSSATAASSTRRRSTDSWSGMASRTRC